MILCILKNKTKIFFDWQKGNASKVGLKFSIRPQQKAIYNLLYRSEYYPSIQ